LGCGREEKPLTEIQFYRSFDAAKADAVRQKKPILIEFFAGWSEHSDTLESITFTDSVVISMSRDILFVRVDAEEDTATARRYAVAGYPTVILTKADGSEIDRVCGFMPPNEFYNQIQLYLQGRETLEDYIIRLEDEPNNPEYLMLIGDKYTGRRQWDKAIEFYNRVLQLDLDNRRGLAVRAMTAIYDAHGRSGDLEAALKTIGELIDRFPASPEVATALAMSGYYTAESGDKKAALIIYRQYLEKYPGGKDEWVRKRIADIEEKL
jgi:tetratricopeptide (TPR) repeat protein